MPSFRKVSGRWSVVFDIPSSDDRRCQKRLSGYSSRREAELAYITFRGENKQIKPKGAYPFEVVYQRYISYRQNIAKESSNVDIKRRFKLHILPYFSGMDITEVKPTDIIDWQASIKPIKIEKRNAVIKELSFKTKENIIGYLKTFFNYCIDIEEIITVNPIKKRIKFIDTDIKEEMLIYSLEEYKQFRSAINKLNDLVLFDLLYFTGARKGELIALQWNDIKNNKISITKTYSRKTDNGKWKITTPKSKNSEREIALPDEILKELAELKNEKQARNADYVLGNQLPTNERYFDNARDKYYIAAGVKRIRIHDFRHSHVSYLFSQNIDIVEIAKRIGDTIQVILKTYAHIIPNRNQYVIDNLNTAFQSII